MTTLPMATILVMIPEMKMDKNDDHRDINIAISNGAASNATSQRKIIVVMANKATVQPPFLFHTIEGREPMTNDTNGRICECHAVQLHTCWDRQQMPIDNQSTQMYLLMDVTCRMVNETEYMSAM
jgi:hypothetical protein